MLTTATAESGKAGRSLNSIPTRVEKTLSNLYMYKIDAEVSKGDAPGGFPERDTVKQQPHSSVHSFDKHVLALVAWQTLGEALEECSLGRCSPLQAEVCEEMNDNTKE